MALSIGLSPTDGWRVAPPSRRVSPPPSGASVPSRAGTPLSSAAAMLVPRSPSHLQFDPPNRKWRPYPPPRLDHQKLRHSFSGVLGRVHRESLVPQDAATVYPVNRSGTPGAPDLRWPKGRQRLPR